jgi:hypothetical protein
MRRGRGWQVVVGIVLVAVGAAGCGSRGGTTSSGAFQVVFTDERLETQPGNQCVVRGNATNAGNVRAQVDLTYEALNATGVVIGTATASFEVAAFSNNDFRSTSFDTGVPCSAIDSFRRTRTDISAA